MGVEIRILESRARPVPKMYEKGSQTGKCSGLHVREYVGARKHLLFVKSWVSCSLFRCKCVRMGVWVGVCMCVYTFVYLFICRYGVASNSMLLNLVDLFAKEPYKRDYILQKRPMILRSLLIVATSYASFCSCFLFACVYVCMSWR